MGKLGRLVVIVAALAVFVGVAPGTAHADASISLGGAVVRQSARTLSVPITATCDDVGQESTFIVVTVTQGFYLDPNYVEGQGDVLSVTCDSIPHTYIVSVPVTFGRATWRPGQAALTAIISYCYSENGSLSCTTQAFIPAGTTITIHSR
jgi:hypothetical protein